jgi:3-dehydroquinate synthase
MQVNPLHTLRMTLDGVRDYDIAIGADLLKNAGQIIAERFGIKNIFIVHDAQVQTHLHTLQTSLEASGHSIQNIELTEGEAAKSWGALERTVTAILNAKPDRHTLILALGGGVVGDHTGFAAAISLRGLDYIQVPTTLLAQVDSSVGGKTGINTSHGKNLVGAFYQPRLVLIDTETLTTLPHRHMLAGYAEIVKYAFIRDTAFFEWLEANGADVIARAPDALTHAIATSCQVKADIVGTDEREAAARALLNFGHTFGHALEAACQYDRRLLHGEAVSVGMALAFATSAHMGLCPEADATKAIAHMARMDLPTRISDIQDFPALTAEHIIDLMGSDKKASGGRLTFILSRGIGQAFITQDVDMNIIHTIISRSLRGAC